VRASRSLWDRAFLQAMSSGSGWSFMGKSIALRPKKYKEGQTGSAQSLGFKEDYSNRNQKPIRVNFPPSITKEGESPLPDRTPRRPHQLAARTFSGTAIWE
jgi:hypothetical protein